VPAGDARAAARRQIVCLVVVIVKERGQSEPGEQVFADAAHIECEEGKVVVIGLFGDSKSLEGEVRSIDLVNNQVIVER